MNEETQPKKARIHRDEVKERHTTHWDLDVLPDAEIERLHRQGHRARWRLDWRWLALAAGVVLTGLSVLGLFLADSA